MVKQLQDTSDDFAASLTAGVDQIGTAPAVHKETAKKGGQDDSSGGNDAAIPIVRMAKGHSREKKESKVTVMRKKVDPNRVRMNPYHDRMDDSLNAVKCESLVASIMEETQKEACVVRRVIGDPDIDYELANGARRRWAVSHIRNHMDPTIQLDVEIRDLSDVEMILLMWIENEEREPITDYERGVNFRRITGEEPGCNRVMTRQDIMEKYPNIDKGKLAKMISCAELQDYPQILGIVIDTSEIPFTYGYELVTAMNESAAAKAKVLRLADKMIAKEERLTAVKAIKHLLAAVGDPNTKTGAGDGAIELKDGDRVLLRAKIKKGGGIALDFSRGSVAEGKQVLRERFEQLLSQLPG